MSESSLAHATLRIARPTDRLGEVVRFYVEGVGLAELGRFEDHEGFDGVMLGFAGAPWHLELTHRRGELVGGAPNEEHLLVFYLPAERDWRAACARMVSARHERVTAKNPYWDRHGQTFVDPDGYRVVLVHGEWP